MSTEHTNPEGEVADDDLVNLIAGRLTAGEEPEQEEETEEPQVEEVEQETEVEEPQVRRLKVKIDGQEVELPEDEVVAGYSRQADYTRKTQEVAEQRKAVEQERQAVAQARMAYDQQLQAAQQYLASLEPQIDMKQLRETDLVKWMEVKAEQEERRERMSQLQAERQRVFQQHQEEQQHARAERLKAEAERVSKALPEYADPVKGNALRSAIRAYGLANGFSDEELTFSEDGRAVLMLNKARLYDEIVAKAKAIKPKPVSAATPGVSRVPTDARKKAMDRLKQSGSDADALAAIKTLL